MSLDQFPESIDPNRIFAQRGSIRGEIPLDRFQRLKEYLSDSTGHADVHLDFGYDEHGRRLVTGKLNATLLLQCQRCLEDLPFEVEIGLRVLVVANDDEARALPIDEEAVVVGESLNLPALVEDELILSLPIVPYHDDEQCNEELNRIQREEPEAGENNPFARLKELKVGKSRDE